MEYINLIGYNSCSVTDGIGLREVIYVSYCTHSCLGCQNQKYWNDSGEKYLIDVIVDKLYTNPLTDITISGGDGLTVQYENTLELCKRLKNKGNKNIWLYTGYTYDDLFEIGKDEILKYIDILVDGRFDVDKRNVTLKFRGSSNQRLVDVQKSLESNRIILWENNNEIY